MAGTQHLLAMATAFLLANTPSGKLDVVGVVVQANHASLDAQEVAQGTTVYDGDRLSTDADGTLRVLVGEAMVDLRQQSSARVRDASRSAGRDFAVELESGVATLSVTAADGGEIVACGAHVRPVAQQRGVVRVQVVGPRELLVYAHHGAAEVAYRSEKETIPEGKTYRVLLNPGDDERSGTIARAPGRSKKTLLLVALSAGAATVAGLALGLTEKQSAVESPDHP